MYRSTDLPIDIHMLVTDEPEHLVSAALASLAPVIGNLHVCAGIPGRTGLARAQAYARGDRRYVSFADPDDLYYPDAFAACAKALDEDPQVGMCYTDELRGTEQQYVPHAVPYDAELHKGFADHVHGIHVLRREFAEMYYQVISELNGGQDWVMSRLMSMHGTVHRVPAVGRLWRPRAGQAHRRLDQADLMRRVRVIEQGLLAC